MADCTSHARAISKGVLCETPAYAPPPDIWPRVTTDGDLKGLLALGLWPRYRGGTPTGSSVSLSLQALVPLMLCCSAER